MTRKFKMNESLLFVMVLVFVAVIGMFRMYDKKDQTKYQDTLEAIEKVNKQYALMNDLVTKNIESVGKLNTRVTFYDDELNALERECVLYETKIGAVNERCDKLVASDIELQRQVSRLRPVIKVLPQPTPVEVIGQGAGALFNPKPKGKKEVGR